MLKRDLSYHLLSRELRALDELFSREPEDRAKWAGFARVPQDNKDEKKLHTKRKKKPSIWASDLLARVALPVLTPASDRTCSG